MAIALLVLGALAALTWSAGARGRMVLSAPAAPVPVELELGLWSGTRLPVDARARELLETDELSLMEYRMGQEPPVWLGRVAGFGSRAAFHPPELRSVGSHVEVLERQPLTVLVHGRSLDLMRLVIGQDGQQYEAWYWFTANGRVTPSYYRQQLWLVLDAIHGRPMSGTLVRISTSADDPKAARRRLLAFLTAFQTTDGSSTLQVARHGL